MEQSMKKRFMQLAAVVLAVSLCIPVGTAAKHDDIKIRVGLASSSSHNPLGELEAAHLQNNSGYGAGFRFGYFDEELEFVELDHTDDSVTQIAVLKTQNLGYGYVESQGKNSYSSDIEGDTVVGCYHVQLPGPCDSYEEARDYADVYDGYVAWINGEYQVRVGAYETKDDALEALEDIGEGDVVGTSSYGLSVVELGTDRILFQFDEGEGRALAVMPDVTGEEDVRTWFSGFKYRGGFSYERIDGGNITVVNVLDLEDYIKGVVCYEMGREWPLEALKTQAICARTYALRNLGTHKSLGFDMCNTDYCQVYNGVGSNRDNYGPTEISDQAVEETAGQVVWYGDELAATYYSSSHGGASESAKHIWGTNMSKYPYLCGVEDPYEKEADDINGYSPWTVRYTRNELTQKLQSRGYGIGTKVDELELTYSELGNVIGLKVRWKNGQKNSFSPDSIRSCFGLRSIRFTVNGETVRQTDEENKRTDGNRYLVNDNAELDHLDGLYVISGEGKVSDLSKDVYVITDEGTVAPLEEKKEESKKPTGTNQGGGTVVVSDSEYIFEGRGWGHQIGMSQFGSYAMAELGFACEEIVEFYFPGTEVDYYE